MAMTRALLVLLVCLAMGVSAEEKFNFARAIHGHVAAALAALKAKPPALPEDHDDGSANLDQADAEPEPPKPPVKEEPVKCANDCSGKGKCEATEDDTVACTCDAGYHGEDCSELDDQFDVYWNSVMFKSKTASLRPRMEHLSRRESYLTNRISALKKKMQDEDEDERRFVDKIVKQKSVYLDYKEGQVKEHQKHVDELTSEVGSLQSNLEDGIQKLITEHVGDPSTHQGGIMADMWDNMVTKQAVENAKATQELRDTAATALKLGEHTRFNRIIERWQLCDINPNHPDCQKKVKDSKPGVHVVVEAKKAYNHYPEALSADEKQHSAAPATKKRLL